MNYKISILAFLWLASIASAAQQDTLRVFKGRPTQEFEISGQKYKYPKPRFYTPFALLPRTYQAFGKEVFRKESLKAIGATAAASALLIVFDQEITDGMQQFSRYIGLDNRNMSKSLIKFKIGSQDFNVYDAPQNLNTAIYSIGEGLPPLLIAAGLAVHGAVKKNYRSYSTAGQIVQAITAFGITSQLLKRSFGRETHRSATQPGGAWRPFPNWGVYQKNVPSYDAMPSGHLGTMMAATVVLADNYPEKKYIKPVGYALTGLVGLSMINNGVHWAGDYPLALGLGYVFGKVTVKMNRFLNENGKK